MSININKLLPLVSVLFACFHAVAGAHYSHKDLYAKVVHDMRKARDFSLALELIREQKEVLVYAEHGKTIMHHLIDVYCRTDINYQQQERINKFFESLYDLGKGIPGFSELIKELQSPHECPSCHRKYGPKIIVLYLQCPHVHEPHNLCLDCAVAQTNSQGTIMCPICLGTSKIYNPCTTLGEFEQIVDYAEPLSVVEQADLRAVLSDKARVAKGQVPYSLGKKNELMYSIANDTHDEESEDAGESSSEGAEEQVMYSESSAQIADVAYRFQELAQSLFNSEEYYYFDFDRYYGEDLLSETDQQGKGLEELCAETYLNKRYAFYEIHYRCYSNAFYRMLFEGKNYPAFYARLDNVVRVLLSNEVDYAVLINQFNSVFPNYIALYKQGTRHPVNRLSELDLKKKESAHLAAQLILDLTRHNKNQLDRAFELVHDFPSLAHAYCATGESILYRVAILYVASKKYGLEKRAAMLEAFFCFLLLNGVDPSKKRPHTAITFNHASGWIGNNTPGKYTYEARGNWGSVEELVRSDPTYSVLNDHLQAIRKDRNAPFVKFPWLEEEMPVKMKPAIGGGENSSNDDESSFDEDSADDAREDEAQKQKKRISESWKPTLKTLAFGMVAGIVLYRYWYAPGSNPELLKNARSSKAVGLAKSSY